LRRRLSRKHQAGFQHAQMQDALQIEAEKENHPHDCAVGDQRNQCIDEKGGIVCQKTHVKDGQGGCVLFVHGKNAQQRKAGGQGEHRPPSGGDPGGSERDGADTQAVEYAAAPVVGFVGIIGPVLTDGQGHEQPGRQTQWGNQKKDVLPSECGGDKPCQSRTKGYSGIHADGGDAEHASAHGRRCAGHQDGKCAGVHHGRAYGLQETTGEKNRHVRRKGSHRGHNQKNRQTGQKNPAASPNVADTSREQMKDG